MASLVTAVEREEGAERAAHAEVLGALRLVLGWIEGVQGGHDAGAAKELAGAALDRLVSPDALQAERRLCLARDSPSSVAMFRSIVDPLPDLHGKPDAYVDAEVTRRRSA